MRPVAGSSLIAATVPEPYPATTSVRPDGDGWMCTSPLPAPVALDPACDSRAPLGVTATLNAAMPSSGGELTVYCEVENASTVLVSFLHVQACNWLFRIARWPALASSCLLCVKPWEIVVTLDQL
jgi:hypothetical protein